jgi:nitrogen fixation NifU-like protein
MTIPEPKLDDLYREVVLDHYRNPRGKKPVNDPHACNEGFNPVCGDEVKVAFRLDGDTMGELEVQGMGCSISVASGSIMAEHLRGRSLDELRKIYDAFKSMLNSLDFDGGIDIGDLEALEGVKKFPIRIKCALLPWVTLHDAIDALENGKVSPEEASSTESE